MAEKNLHIAERLRKLLPPLTTEERKQLKENIEADGKVRDVVLWWHDGSRNVVVDGMHRWEIVRGTDIPYDTEEMHFTDYEEAELWILNHQLGRRNLLKPSDIRKITGELYNRLKAKRGGDRKSQESKGQNVPLIGDTAQEIAEKAGISSKTVKRHGARVEVEAKLSRAAQHIADKATDADVKLLSRLSFGDQDQVARSLRTGQAKSVKDALKGFKPPESNGQHKSSSNGKAQPKKKTRDWWFKQWMQSVGPLCRLVDKIAEDVGEPKSAWKDAVQQRLRQATESMTLGLEVNVKK